MAWILPKLRALRVFAGGIVRGSRGTGAGADPLARARHLEARADLAEATAAYLEAGAADDAARVLEVRAESAALPERRLELLAQAATVSTGDAKRRLRARRARLAIDFARAGSVRFGPAELDEMGRELERLGEASSAADAFALAGNTDAEVRAGAAAGDIERVEAALADERLEAARARRRSEGLQAILDLHSCGHRRSALEVARTLEDQGGRVGEVVREIESTRVVSPRSRLEIGGQPIDVVFGEVVTLGRGDATISLSSAAVSRTHLEVRRTSRGLEAKDLGSQNGTMLAGARLSTPVAIGSGLRLSLGDEVPVRIEPWRDGVVFTLGERRLHAPLGPLVLGALSIDLSIDGWLEARSSGALFLGLLAVDSPVQLCVGDTLRLARGAPPVVEVRP